jgi:hypothetical protein
MCSEASFNSISGATSVVLPSTVTLVAGNAFTSSSITTLTFKSEKVVGVSSNSFSNSVTLRVPAKLVATYKNTEIYKTIYKLVDINSKIVAI